jgi:inhibitor of cysteine peptidase
MKERLGEMAVSISVLTAILAVVVMAGICGCSAQSALALEGADDGREVTLQKGQTLTIKLEGNPTTGYSWEVVESEGAIVQQVGEPEFEADSDLLGAPGTQTLRFEAVETGQMELKLVYQRPWETDVEPLETFTVQVTVQ